MKREILVGVIMAVLATVVTFLVTRSLDDTAEKIDAGDQAQQEELIREVMGEVLKQELTTDDGRTYGEVLVEVNNRLITMETTVKILTE